MAIDGVRAFVFQACSYQRADLLRCAPKLIVLIDC